MLKVVEYNDYREFLRSWIEHQKCLHPHFSMRWFAKRIGVDSGFLVHVLQGSKHAAETWIEPLIKAIGLKGREAEYFTELLLFNKAKSEREISERFQRLCNLRDLETYDLEHKQYQYWSQWRYPAMRVMLMAREFRGDFSQLGAWFEPPLSAQEAQESVQTLLDLGLVQISADGVYESVQNLVSTGVQWKSDSVKCFQEQMMHLALRSLQTHSADVREISTLTLSIPGAEISTLQEMVRQFRAQVLRWASAFDDADSVIQVNTQVFPLSQPPEAK